MEVARGNLKEFSSTIAKIIFDPVWYHYLSMVQEYEGADEASKQTVWDHITRAANQAPSRVGVKAGDDDRAYRVAALMILREHGPDAEHDFAPVADFMIDALLRINSGMD